MTNDQRYPLSWPTGRPRTSFRTSSKFKVDSFTRVRDELLNELKLMQATGVILSSNLKLRQDGLPLAGQNQPNDPGVAVYFSRKGRQLCFACDQWRKIEENMQAIRHTINALRGIARWGTGDMVDAAFAGFAALPAAGRPWHEVLRCDPSSNAEAIRSAYIRQIGQHHPDRGGTHEAAQEVNDAFATAQQMGLVS